MLGGSSPNWVYSPSIRGLNGLHMGVTNHLRYLGWSAKWMVTVLMPVDDPKGTILSVYTCGGCPPVFVKGRRLVLYMWKTKNKSICRRIWSINLFPFHRSPFDWHFLEDNRFLLSPQFFEDSWFFTFTVCVGFCHFFGWKTGIARGVPVPVISKVITPLKGVITPVTNLWGHL